MAKADKSIKTVSKAASVKAVKVASAKAPPPKASAVAAR